MLHQREIAVGSAAIDTMSQIGALAAPYAWGLSKDLTASFCPAHVVLTVAAIALTAPILVMRQRVGGRSNDRAAVSA